jgi:hypothetical protein
VALQVLGLVAIVAAAVLARSSLRAGVALAAIAPAEFLLTNRVFSAQYMVTLVAAWAVAGALLARSAGDQLGLGLLVLGASLANYLVYPTHIYERIGFSALMFLLAFTATGWAFLRALQRSSMRRAA